VKYFLTRLKQTSAAGSERILQNLENRILNSEEEKSQANDSCERKPGPSAHPQDGGRARAETKIGLQREAIPAS